MMVQSRRLQWMANLSEEVKTADQIVLGSYAPFAVYTWQL